MKYALLNEDWLLRGWKEGSFLYNWKNGKLYPLKPEELYVLRCCDGNNDFDSMAFLPAQRRCLEEYCEKGVVRVCEKGTPFLENQKYRLAQNQMLLGVLLSITGRCNFNCRHCYMEAPKRNWGEFTKEELLYLLNEMEKVNVQEIALTGGEPLLHPHIRWFIHQLSERSLYLSEIFTNASLITEDFLVFLKDCGYRPVFKVSFDGVGTHDYMRGKEGAQEETLRGIRLLVKHGFETVIVSCIDQKGAKTLGETFALLRDIGIQQWWISKPVESGNWKGSDSGLTLEEMSDCMEDVLRMWAAQDRPFHLKLWIYGRYCKRGEGPFVVREPVSKNDMDYVCGASHFFACIQPDGVLVPCAGYIGSELSNLMPNVKLMPFSEAWEDSMLRKAADIRKETIAKANKECRDCEYFYSCAGGCPSSSFVRTGRQFEKDTLTCRAFREGFKERFRRLGDQLMAEWEKKNADKPDGEKKG